MSMDKDVNAIRALRISNSRRSPRTDQDQHHPDHQGAAPADAVAHRPPDQLRDAETDQKTGQGQLCIAMQLALQHRQGRQVDVDGQGRERHQGAEDQQQPQVSPNIRRGLGFGGVRHGGAHEAGVRAIWANERLSGYHSIDVCLSPDGREERTGTTWSPTYRADVQEMELTHLMRTVASDEHEIMNGDAVECLKSIETASIDLIFADPPYDIGKDFDGIHVRVDEAEYFEWCW